MPEKVVITGGSGFIGSHLAEELLKLDFEVVVFDNFSTGNIDNLKEAKQLVKVVKGDIRNYQEIEKAVSGATFVFHLAALSYVGESIKIPESYNQVNIDGTLNVLKACRSNSVEKFIFPSTCIVYGNPSKSPTSENEPLNAHTPYGFTKVAGEFYSKFFYEVHGLQTICLRIFNAYGPRMRQRVINKFADLMLENKPPVINGNGEQKRDFIFVSDIVDGFVKAMKAKKMLAGKSFNIGTGESTNLKELVEKINYSLGTNIPIQFQKEVSGETDEIIADVTLAEKELGFSSKVGLDNGLKITMQWLKNDHKNRKK